MTISPYSHVACSSNATLHISTEAIRYNVTALSSRLSSRAQIMGMVKANGYGTDMCGLAETLQQCGVAIVGVAQVQEAVALRSASFSGDIFVFHSIPNDMHHVVEGGFEIAIGDKECLDALEYHARKRNTPVKVHLHVDTGMGRLGCRSEDMLMLAEEIRRSPYLLFHGFMTHFTSSSHSNEDDFTRQQEERFASCAAALQAHEFYPRHIHAPSSGLLTRQDMNIAPWYTMARVGIALFGVYPNHEHEALLDLMPALTLKTRVAGFNEYTRGDTVSYGKTYTVEKASARAAILPIGYYDGIHRCYSNTGYVIIRGCKAPVIGRICMDYMMVDITDIEGVEYGDVVTVFGGEAMSAEDFAHNGGTSGYELITCLGARVRRVFES
jgi:Alr-MurF fusion protein